MTQPLYPYGIQSLVLSELEPERCVGLVEQGSKEESLFLLRSDGVSIQLACR
jgi:hypothetical protein